MATSVFLGSMIHSKGSFDLISWIRLAFSLVLASHFTVFCFVGCWPPIPSQHNFTLSVSTQLCFSFSFSKLKSKSFSTFYYYYFLLRFTFPVTLMRNLWLLFLFYILCKLNNDASLTSLSWMIVLKIILIILISSWFWV